MNKILAILVALIFFSCANNKKADLDYTGMYNLLNDDFDNRIYDLIGRIEYKVDFLSTDNPDYGKIIKYDSLTRNYFDYINEIEKQLSNEKHELANPFFNKKEKTEKGKEYILKTQNYLIQIQKQIDISNLKTSFSNLLGVSDFKTRDGQTIDHLEFYFYEIPKSGIITYLKNKKRNILELEDEFLSDKIIQDFRKKMDLNIN